MEISAKELAQLINVSPATVSMVFNNKPGISEATRDLVLTTAAKYGYTPKSAPPASASSRVIQLINYKSMENSGRYALLFPADGRHYPGMPPSELRAAYFLFL